MSRMAWRKTNSFSGCIPPPIEYESLSSARSALKPATFTLDGEVAGFDEDLVSRFEWLRHLNHGDLATPPLYMAFDLLQLGEKDYRPEPLKVRRKALERLPRGQTLILPAPRMRPNRLAASTQRVDPRWGGMVGRGPGSEYVGAPAPSWLNPAAPNARTD